MKLSEVRKSIIGENDDYHYRSLSGRAIGMPVSRRYKAVLLCSENSRYGYRGVAVIEKGPSGWDRDEDRELFEQDNPRSFSAMIGDMKELGWI